MHKKFLWAWSILTFFVILMIFEEKGVIDSIKKSLGLFRKTRGENIVGRIGLRVVTTPVIPDLISHAFQAKGGNI